MTNQKKQSTEAAVREIRRRVKLQIQSAAKGMLVRSHATPGKRVVGKQSLPAREPGLVLHLSRIPSRRYTEEGAALLRALLTGGEDN